MFFVVDDHALGEAGEIGEIVLRKAATVTRAAKALRERFFFGVGHGKIIRAE